MRIVSVTIFILINVAVFAQSTRHSSGGVGDIAFDPATDNPKFQLCDANNMWQGYQLKTKEDETSLMVAREFRAKYRYNGIWSGDNGIIRIRFVVNCKGEADRYRLLELDNELKPKQFTNELKAHVLEIVKGISWPTRRAGQRTVDYYHYISVRMNEGELEVVQ